MTDKMLERMARAIDPSGFEDPDDFRAAAWRADAFQAARAALEAIRPGFGDLPHITTDYATTLTAFNTVIDAILSEEEGLGSRPAAPSVPTEQTGGPVVGWQSIETAPVHASILVCVTHNLGPDEWETVQWVDSCDQDGRWMTYPRLIEIPFPPTLWMPLPAAPDGTPSQAQDGYEADAIGEVNQAPSPPEKA